VRRRFGFARTCSGSPLPPPPQPDINDAIIPITETAQYIPRIFVLREILLLLKKSDLKLPNYGFFKNMSTCKYGAMEQFLFFPCPGSEDFGTGIKLPDK
jgi:hypothetical protein